MSEDNICYITIMAHKPCGVWKTRWFSVTDSGPEAHAFSVPFGKAKDIVKYVDEAKARHKRVTFKLIWVKEDPTLSWYDEESSLVDWRDIFVGAERR